MLFVVANLPVSVRRVGCSRSIGCIEMEWIEGKLRVMGIGRLQTEANVLLLSVWEE